jgi:DNA-binding response OmpR family regulator
MHRRLTRILLVEDEELDAESVSRALEAGPLERGGVALDHVVTLQEGLDRLAKGDVDVVLLDLNLPDSSGVATILSLREHDGRVPLVVFTCAGDEDTAVAALEAGAQDYLVKDELGGPLLRRAIRYAIERRRITDETGRLQERLRQAEKRESRSASTTSSERSSIGAARRSRSRMLQGSRSGCAPRSSRSTRLPSEPRRW